MRRERGGAARHLIRIWAQDARMRDDARLASRLGRAAADFAAAHARAVAIGDCKYVYPGLLYYADLTSALSTLRDATCPGCGARCPCRKAADIDRVFPPGAFDAMGGTLCDTIVGGGPAPGITAADDCQIPNAASFPRAGVQVLSGLQCWVAPGDLDPSDSGICHDVGFSQPTRPGRRRPASRS